MGALSISASSLTESYPVTLESGGPAAFRPPDHTQMSPLNNSDREPYSKWVSLKHNV